MAGPAFERLPRARLQPYEADRPERLDAAYFRRAEPEELLYDEIEAIWAPIAERDDWAPVPRQARAHRRGARGVGDRRTLIWAPCAAQRFRA